MLLFKYLYENTMFTNKLVPALFGKEKFGKLGEERKVLALIKSLFYPREKKGAWGEL